MWWFYTYTKIYSKRKPGTLQLHVLTERLRVELSHWVTIKTQIVQRAWPRRILLLFKKSNRGSILGDIYATSTSRQLPPRSESYRWLRSRCFHHIIREIYRKIWVGQQEKRRKMGELTAWSLCRDRSCKCLSYVTEIHNTGPSSCISILFMLPRRTNLTNKRRSHVVFSNFEWYFSVWKETKVKLIKWLGPDQMHWGVKTGWDRLTCCELRVVLLLWKTSSKIVARGRFLLSCETNDFSSWKNQTF